MPIFSYYILLKDKKNKGERANSLLNYTVENRKIWSDIFYKCLRIKKKKKRKYILALISRGQVLWFAVNKCYPRQFSVKLAYIWQSVENMP